MVRIALIGVMVVVRFSTAFGQTYNHYFFSKVMADSLVAKGDYAAALPYLRICVFEPAMVTVVDEFRFGYAHFKQNSIDTAAMFMHKALVNGYHFTDMEQVKHWSDAGVFERFRSYPSLRGLDKLLKSNTQAYVNNTIDSVLLKPLLAALQKDQLHRGSDLDFSIQQELDVENQKLLRKIIEEHGWPTRSMVGWQGSMTAFLIAQHSDNDVNFQRECLEYIRQAHYRQDIEPSAYPYIMDRVLINSNKTQVFGTQYDKPMEDPSNVNIRRKIFGLETLEDYLKKRK